jgi:hypothetical protein
MPGRDIIENRGNAISDLMDLENTLKKINATALQPVFLCLTTA